MPKTRDMTEVRARLAQFAEWTNTTPPAKLLDGEGEDATFSDELLAYCEETDLSLDWVWLDSAKSYALGAYNRTRREADKNADDAGRAQKKNLDACQYDAVMLHSLILGMEILHDHGTMEAGDAIHAIIATATKRAGALARDLDEISISERRASA